MRRDYRRNVLDERHLPEDPSVLCRAWLEEVLQAGLPEPNAVVLATATPDGIPSARVVLLKGMDERGLIFFTNYESRKALELEANPRAALLFFWEPLERQLRIEGSVDRLAPNESDRYFDSRPFDSRISALVSPQSRKVDSRQALEQLWQKAKSKAESHGVQRPDHWGGLLLSPSAFEFWQGRENRLHDRIIYRREGMRWQVQRLAP